MIGRAHYEPVSKSKLRKREEAPLGPRYEGSRVGRQGLVLDDSDHDPFDHYESDEGSDDADVRRGNGRGDDEDDSDEGSSIGNGALEGEGSDTDDTSLSEHGTQRDHDQQAADRAELQQLLSRERATVTTSIAEATRADAEKGRAVQKQRKTFDDLLNSRIRMQQALVATNTMPTLTTVELVETIASTPFDAAESALRRLWSSIDGLRQQMAEIGVGEKRKRRDISIDAPMTEMWGRMQGWEEQSRPVRRKVLQNWSTKTQAASARPAAGRLNQNVRQSTVVDVLDEQLANPERLAKRTRVPRSGAPVQAKNRVTESKEVFDDADFYGVMLKELLEQRSANAASQASSKLVLQQWQAIRDTKTKKHVDTKASKGRKMRFTVHEKLQNFMAPEDLCSWGERQIDELFGSLLGKRLAVVEGDEAVEQDDGDEAALRLFRI